MRDLWRWAGLLLLCVPVQADARSSAEAFGDLAFGDSGETVLRKIRAAADAGVFQCTVADCAYTNASYEFVSVQIRGREYQVYWTLEDDALWEVVIVNYPVDPEEPVRLREDWEALVLTISGKHGKVSEGAERYPERVEMAGRQWEPTHRWALEGKRIDVGVHCVARAIREGRVCHAWTRIVDPQIDRVARERRSAEPSSEPAARSDSDLF